MTRFTYTDANGEIILIREYLTRNRLTCKMFKSIYYDISDPDLVNLGYYYPITVNIKTPCSVLNLTADLVLFQHVLYVHLFRIPYIPGHSTVLFKRIEHEGR